MGQRVLCPDVDFRILAGMNELPNTGSQMPIKPKETEKARSRNHGTTIHTEHQKIG